MTGRSSSAPALRGFLARLAGDTRGNALAMMAAMLIPLAAFSGSAIDMARLYTVKTRLQQACDAGVLAGRKSMDTTNTSTTLDSTAAAQAQTFFANNFKVGFFGSQQLPTNPDGSQPPTFTPTKTSDSQVQGNAQVRVPMTIMRMFGQPVRTISVSCIARYDVADADIMFVLDTTGSMACLPSDSDSTCDSYDGSNVASDNNGYYVTEKNNSRIAAVRAAVLSFFDTVTGQADQTTNFRFGFVPFSVAVNVGKLLQNKGYMATAWSYQSREVIADALSGNPTTSTVSANSQQACTGSSTSASVTTRSPASSTPLTYNSNGTATSTTLSWSNGKCTKSVQTLIPNWLYKSESGFPIGQYMNSSVYSPIDNPAQANSATSYWAGCVEERGTQSGQTSFDPANPPLDLDVDKAPSGSTTAQLTDPVNNSFWGPLWSDVQFARNSTNEQSSATRDSTYRPYGNSMTAGVATIYEQIACPLQASPLSTIQLPGSASSSTRSSATSSARTAIQNYMLASNGYRPFGKTYLDAGMTWGTRLLSPTGMFKSDTAAWSGHNDPNRFLIFLTDGAMEPDCYADASHGIEQYDQRVVGSSCPSNLIDYHYGRLAAACTIAKNHNITVFVILFGQSVATLPPQFSACASPGQAYYASNTAALNTAFSKIAAQVAMLRLSK